MTRIRLDAQGLPQISKFDSMRVMTQNGMLQDARKNGYRDNNGKCKVCGGAEQIEIKDEGMTCCVCWLCREERDHRVIQQYATPHPRVEMKDFKVWGDASSKADLSNGLSTVRDWLAKMDRWILIGGPVGTGKSHLLQVIDTILKPWSLYISVPDFKDMVFQGTGNGGLTDLLDKVSVHPVLLLDDVGAEWASGYAVTALRQVIMSRYTNWRDLPTIVATNMTGGQFETYDDRMADRLYDKEKVLHIGFTNVDSWRRYGK